jgi:hypothetical protein
MPHINYFSILFFLTINVLNNWMIEKSFFFGCQVPAEFIVQYPDHANPPTLYIALETLIMVIYWYLSYFQYDTLKHNELNF